MIVTGEDCLDFLLQVCKVHNHTVVKFALDDAFDFVRVSVRYTALGMTRKGMSAVNVVDDTDLHDWDRRIAQPDGGLRKRNRDSGLAKLDHYRYLHDQAKQ